MKFSITRTSLFIFAAWGLLTSARVDPSNPPTAKTGAPGETTCAQSGCHSGGTFTGTVSITGIPDTMELNKTYSVTLTQASNASKAGFELTCLDGSNAKCGTLTVGTGCSVATVSSTGRQYIRQSAAKSLTAGSVSWTFSWKSPTTIPASNDITFYFVSLAANGTGSKTGDNVLSAVKKAIFKTATSPTLEANVGIPMQFYADASHRMLNIDLDGLNSADLKVFDMAGNLVLEQALNAQNAISIASFKSGVFVAQVSAQGKKSVRKFAL